MVGGLLVLALGLLLWIAIQDLRTRMIPDALTIPFIVACLLHAIARWQVDVVAILFLTITLGFQWLVSRGTWVGSGDVFLALGLGLLLPSWQAAVTLLAVAYIAAGIVAAILLLTRRVTRGSHLPFAPFLALGTFVALLFPPLL